MRVFITIRVDYRMYDPVNSLQQIPVLLAQVLDQAVDAVESHGSGDPFTSVDHSVHVIDGLGGVSEIGGRYLEKDVTSLFGNFHKKKQTKFLEITTYFDLLETFSLVTFVRIVVLMNVCIGL